MIYNRVLSDLEVVALFYLGQVNLETGLVAYYPFDGDATDASGNGNDGTVTAGYSGWGGGTPVLTSDRVGQDSMAYYFDQGGNIEVPYSTILNPEDMSISWWMYFEERTNNDYMISMNRWNCYKVNLQEADKVFFTTKVEDPANPGEFIYNDRDHAGDGLTAETWYHLAVSFGDGHMKFYIDGVLVKDWDDVPDARIVDISGEPHNLVFGQARPTSEYTDETGDGDFFKGKLDEIRIYNRVLTDAEVYALYAMPVSIGEPLKSRNFELSQNFPNPFSTITTIRFSQQVKGYTTLKVYNTVGKEVASLISEELMPGNYEYIWDASEMSTGIYLYRLTVNGAEETKKLFLIRE
jgi:hypothetical protein